MTDGEWVPPPPHPTKSEVARVIAAIIRNIDSTPDWWHELRKPQIRPADEAYFQKPEAK